MDESQIGNRWWLDREWRLVGWRWMGVGWEVDEVWMGGGWGVDGGWMRGG